MFVGCSNKTGNLASTKAEGGKMKAFWQSHFLPIYKERAQKKLVSRQDEVLVYTKEEFYSKFVRVFKRSQEEKN